jgi:tRNA-dihydrouridine synthase
LIYYRDKISLAPILRYLETQFEQVKSKELKVLESLPIKFTEPIVDFREFAVRIGISTEAARSFIVVHPPSGYVALANTLVSKEKLLQIGDRIRVAICKSGKLPLKEAARIIEEEGVDDSANVLAMLGYRIRWRGIDSEKAEIFRDPKNSGE